MTFTLNTSTPRYHTGQKKTGCICSKTVYWGKPGRGRKKKPQTNSRQNHSQRNKQSQEIKKFELEGQKQN